MSIDAGLHELLGPVADLGSMPQRARHILRRLHVHVAFIIDTPVEVRDGLGEARRSQQFRGVLHAAARLAELLRRADQRHGARRARGHDANERRSIVVARIMVLAAATAAAMRVLLARVVSLRTESVCSLVGRGLCELLVPNGCAGRKTLRPRSLPVIDMQDNAPQQEHDSSKNPGSALVCLAIAGHVALACSIDSQPTGWGAARRSCKFCNSLSVPAASLLSLADCIALLHRVARRLASSKHESNRIARCNRLTLQQPATKCRRRAQQHRLQPHAVAAAPSITPWDTSVMMQHRKNRSTSSSLRYSRRAGPRRCRTCFAAFYYCSPY